MTARVLARIAVAIVVLLAVWGLGRLLRSGGDSERGGFELAGMAVDSADTIIVGVPGETVTLVRVDSATWTANGKPGSTQAVLMLLAALRDSTPAELVSQSVASFARLGVDTTTATRFRATQGDRVLIDVLVSPQSPDPATAYVRLPGDSAVFAQPGPLATMARRRLDDWRDKNIAVTNIDSVAVIELQRGAKTVVLRRGTGGWRVGTAQADSFAVSRLLDRYQTITAAGFPTAAQLDSAFRGRPDARAALRVASGAALLELEFDSTATDYWARKAGAPKDRIFRLNQWEVAQLLPDEATLRKRN